MPRDVSPALARTRRAQIADSGALVAGRPRHLAWVAAVALAFAVPFGMSAVRGGDVAPAAAAEAEPPAVAAVPALPALRRVAALPAPPRAARRRTQPAATPPQPAATTPARVTPVAPAPVQAPAPAPAPPPTSFDLSG